MRISDWSSDVCSSDLFWDFGLELSAVFNWNSGALYSRTYSLYGRHLPEMVDVPYEYGGVTDTWIVPGTVGGETGPAYYTFRSEEHTSELQSLMRISYAVFCLKKQKQAQREKEDYTKQN